MTSGSGKTIGVVLSGCGVFDGAEIHEATLTLLALDQAGANIVCMAPNVDQMDVVDHAAGNLSVGANRNVLTESARIARGEIRDMATVNVDELDALIFPGGFGAAKNLSNFATDGANCTVNPVVDQLVKNMNLAGKPQGFICIAPAIAAKSLGELKPDLTIGNDPGTAAELTALGANHVNCPVDDIVCDESHKLVSTPAYMLGPSIAHVAKGINKLVEKVLDLS
jgi:enhancing lycopene biosynthesis protein 2